MHEEEIEKADEQRVDRAWRFFDRAREVAKTNNFDYAIDLYMEGLRQAPDEVMEGHGKLREMALVRQVRGGRKPSMMDKIRFTRCAVAPARRVRGKAPLERMLNAERLFAKDPDNLQYAEAILTAALAGDYKKTAQWIADLLFQANTASEKPSLQMYVLLKDSYEAIGQLDRAVVASQFAVNLKPKDKALQDEHQRLSAELTVSKGKYDQQGDFRESVKDRGAQEKLQSQESIVKTEAYTVSAVEDARKALAEGPNVPRNILRLADALSDMEDEKAEDEAIALLENAYKARRDFSFKQRADQVKMKQLRRRMRSVQVVLEAGPDDAEAKAKLAELSAQLNGFELEHYRLCVQNYPTDLQVKYEYGLRLLANKRYDEAIPLFQEAQRDPRNKISAMDKVGLCFFLKGWFTDAVDVFTQTIESYELKDDDVAKELRYNLARVYEEQGETGKALEIYRKIAQLDFAYKDVGKRVDNLRKKST